MAFFVAPHRHDEFQEQIAAIMQRRSKGSLDDALPFAMEPVVYDFRINPHGTLATLDSASRGDDAVLNTTRSQTPRMIAAAAGRCRTTGGPTSTISPTVAPIPASWCGSSGR